MIPQRPAKTDPRAKTLAATPRTAVAEANRVVVSGPVPEAPSVPGERPDGMIRRFRRGRWTLTPA